MDRLTHRKAVVVGATGLIGKHLVLLLLEDNAYAKVTIVVRRPMGMSHPKLHEEIVDFDLLEQADIDLNESDLFCTLGTTIKKAGSQDAFRRVDYDYPHTWGRMALEQGAKQLLIVTAMGANASSRFFYNRVKGDIEDTLRGLALPALHIFRPSLLLGHRDEFRFGEKAGTVVWRIVSPLFSKIVPQKYRPIHARTVAKAMLLIAKNDVKGTHIYESDHIARSIEERI